MTILKLHNLDNKDIILNSDYINFIGYDKLKKVSFVNIDQCEYVPVLESCDKIWNLLSASGNNSKFIRLHRKEDNTIVILSIKTIKCIESHYKNESSIKSNRIIYESVASRVKNDDTNYKNACSNILLTIKGSDTLYLLVNEKPHMIFNMLKNLSSKK